MIVFVCPRTTPCEKHLPDQALNLYVVAKGGHAAHSQTGESVNTKWEEEIFTAQEAIIRSNGMKLRKEGWILRGTEHLHLPFQALNSRKNI